MKLTEKQRQILEFCVDGKTTIELCEHFNVNRSWIYGQLHGLMRKGCMNRMGENGGTKNAIYITQAEPAKTEPPVEESISDHSEFIRFAHDPFNLTGKRGSK